MQILYKPPLSKEKKSSPMTNQNMVISDAKSGLPMAIIAAAMSDSGLFPSAVPRNGYFNARKKLPKKLETNGNGAMINALLDSMRSSSPTRRPSDAEDQNSWIVSYQINRHLFRFHNAETDTCTAHTASSSLRSGHVPGDNERSQRETSRSFLGL